MQYKDYYKILGVEKGATKEEIKKKFRQLAKQYHPDLHPGDEEAEKKFKEINEAYEVLSDDKKRSTYDNFGSNYNFQGGQNFDPNSYGFSHFSSGGAGDFSDFFNLIFGGNFNGSNFSAESSSSSNSGFGGFSDLFGSRRRTQRREPYESNLDLSIEELQNGNTKKLTLNINGTNHNIDVKVPRGMTPNKRIKVRGSKWGLDRDILFSINVIGNGEKLEGLDIIRDLEVYPWEAYFGGEKVAEVEGKKIKLKLPKNIESGKKIRIKSKGFQDMKGNKGDLFFKVKLKNPDTLNEEQENLYKSLYESFNK